MDPFKKFVGLSDEEVQLIDESVQEKLLIAFDSIQNDLTTNRERAENMEAEKESITQDYQKKIDELEKKYSALEKRSSEYDGLIQKTDCKYREAFMAKSELESKLADSLTINSELSCVIKTLESDKEILSEQLKHKVESCDLLTEELKSMRAEAESVRKLKVDALFKLEEVAGREGSLKIQESRWSEEIAAMQRHTDWLEERLRDTTSQLSTIRRDTTNKSQSLQSELELRNTELENARKSVSNLEESVRKLTESNENYIQKIKQVAEEQIRVEQLYGNELEAQKRVVTLYKDQLNESEEKNAELTEAVSSMQGMLKSAYENISRLESEKNNMRQKFSEEKSKLESITQQQNAELEKSRHLLDKFRVDGLSEDELRQLNPAVAATLSALKRGHSLTQLYSDYVQLVEDRDQLRLDKERLTEYVKQLVDDLKEKAPVLRDQQEKYRKTESRLKELSNQLDVVNSKFEEEQAKRQEMQRRAGYYQRASDRLKQTCSDLSRQVQFLLREVEVLRGTVVEEPGLESPDSTDTLNRSQFDRSVIRTADLDQMFINTDSSAEVIDEHLVTWSGLKELQSQNQRLLCVARDLAAQLEQHEREEKKTTTLVSDLTLRVETLSGELDVVRMTAREARAETQAVTRQRDMYQALLKHYDIEVSRAENESTDEKLTSEDGKESAMESVDSSVHSLPAGNHLNGKSLNDTTANVSNVDRLEETLASLEAEFKRYREDKLESDKIYTTTIEQLRKESGEARLLNQKLAAQLDFSHEKLRVMEANVAGYKQEITVLREMNARYSTSAATSEAELTRLREDLLRTSDKLLEVEVDARHSARQLELARANEARWKQENETLRRQDQMHIQLMHQLEAIQSNLEQRESSDRVMLERRVSQLETQLAESRSAFTEATQSCKTIKETLEHELELASQKLVDEQATTEQLQTQLAAVEQELKDLKPNKDAKIDTTSEESDDHVTREFALESASRNRELQLELDGLRMRLDSARQQTEQMRTLATEAETRLVEATEENKLLEQRLSQELNESKQRCEFLEAQLDLEKKERQNLVNENIRTTEEAHHMNAELRRELAEVQSDLQSTKARCESALQLEAGAKAEIEAHERVAQEAREKYERELALHAQDVESLTDVRKQVDDLKTQVGDLQRQCSTSESKAQIAASELTAQNALWQSEREQLTEKLQQADKDQDLLQEQLIKLTQQLISLRKVMENAEEKDSLPITSSTEASDSSMLGDLKTSEDLMQLVNYLRRQKNIAEASCDATAAENSRLLLRIASLEEQINHLRAELNHERKASELATETTQRHSELMERVEQLNLVTESNRLLRHERETLRNSLTEMEKQLETIRDTIGPIREQNSFLQARVDSLSGEQRSLEDERDRWKERCNRLVETAQRMDPEQYRLACNERDELQRKLHRTEDELQHVQSKVNELRGELEDRTKKLEQEITVANSSRQDIENRCGEYSAQCDALRRDLEASETTVAKLREIGRKYRQETATLRRQLALNQSDESHRQSIEEALTETRADLVNLRGDLAVERSQKSQLAADLQDISRILEELRTQNNFSTLMSSISTASLDSDASAEHSVPATLRAIFTVFSSEIDRLHQQADVQRERLLRLMLIESQLTKALRENTELRSRLNELQSSRSAQVPTSMDGSCIASTSESETAESAHNSLLVNSVRTTLTPVTPSDPSAVESMSSQEPPSVGLSMRPVSLPQPVVPAWIVRASTNVAAMQPVPPTPSVTPPSTVVTGPKQTAEIRPITSNVATVIPTPSLQPVPTASLATPGDSFFTSTVQISPSHSVTTQESSGPCTTAVASSLHIPMDHSALFRADAVSGGSVRSATTRRSGLGAGESQSTTVTTSLPFGWASGSAAQGVSTSFVNSSGKRRLDEANGSGEMAAAACGQISADEVSTSVAPTTTVSSVSSPDATRSWDTSASSAHPIPPCPSSLFSEAKRPRQTGATVPMATTQSGSNSVALSRPVFAHSVTPQATASRLFLQAEHTGDTWGFGATSVTGIVSPFTSSVAAAPIAPTGTLSMDSSVSSSSSFTPVTVVRSSVATDSSEVTGSATSCEVSDSRLNMLHSSTMELSHGAGASVSSEFVSADDIPEQSTSAPKSAHLTLSGGVSYLPSAEVHQPQKPSAQLETENVPESPEATGVQHSTVLNTDLFENQPRPTSQESVTAAQEEVEMAPNKDETKELVYESNAENVGQGGGMEEEEEEDDDGEEGEESDDEEMNGQRNASGDECEPCFDDDDEDDEVDVEPDAEEDEEDGEVEEEEDDLDAPVAVGANEVIELSSESENSEDGVENLEDYAEEETQESVHLDEEDGSGQIMEQRSETGGLEVEETVNREDKVDDDDDDEHDEGSSYSEDEADDYELAEHDDGAITQSRVDTDTELAEQADDDSQLIDEVPATADRRESHDVPPSTLSTVSSSTVTTTGTCGSSLFSSSIHYTGGLFGSAVVTSSTVSDSKPNFFTASRGLFSGIRTPSTSTNFSHLPKPSSFSNTDSGVAESMASGGPSTSSFFRPSILSNQFQYSSASPLCKTALFPPRTTSAPVSTETTVTTTATIPTSSANDSAPNRPKIQPIVWDAAQSPGASGQKTVEESPRVGAGRRKKWGPTFRTNFSGPSSSAPSGASFGATRETGAPGPGALRAKPHPRR